MKGSSSMPEFGYRLSQTSLLMVVRFMNISMHAELSMVPHPDRLDEREIVAVRFHHV